MDEATKKAVIAATLDSERFLKDDYRATESFLSDAMATLEQAQALFARSPNMPVEVEVRLRAKAAELQDLMEQQAAGAIARLVLLRTLDEAIAKHTAKQQPVNE